MYCLLKSTQSPCTLQAGTNQHRSEHSARVPRTIAGVRTVVWEVQCTILRPRSSGSRRGSAAMGGIPRDRRICTGGVSSRRGGKWSHVDELICIKRGAWEEHVLLSITTHSGSICVGLVNRVRDRKSGILLDILQEDLAHCFVLVKYW